MREIGENPAHLPDAISDGEDESHPNHEEGEEQEEDGQGENKRLTRRSITTTWTPG